MFNLFDILKTKHRILVIILQHLIVFLVSKKIYTRASSSFIQLVEETVNDKSQINMCQLAHICDLSLKVKS